MARREILETCAMAARRKQSKQHSNGTFCGNSRYDVENNQDLFYKEIADGVNVITSLSQSATAELLVLQRKIATHFWSSSLLNFEV